MNRKNERGLQKGVVRRGGLRQIERKKERKGVEEVVVFPPLKLSLHSWEDLGGRGRKRRCVCVVAEVLKWWWWWWLHTGTVVVAAIH